MAKNAGQTFVIIAKITAKTSNHGPVDHYAVYKTQQQTLTTIITCSRKFSSVKFCRCAALKTYFYDDVMLTYWEKSNARTLITEARISIFVLKLKTTWLT